MLFGNFKVALLPIRPPIHDGLSTKEYLFTEPKPNQTSVHPHLFRSISSSKATTPPFASVLQSIRASLISAPSITKVSPSKLMLQNASILQLREFASVSRPGFSTWDTAHLIRASRRSERFLQSASHRRFPLYSVAFFSSE